MIGVIAQPEDRDVVTEFFELFKTPWEFCQSGRRYEVLLCASDGLPAEAAPLILLYGAAGKASDARHGFKAVARNGETTLAWRGERFPVYEGGAVFPDSGWRLLENAGTHEPAASLTEAGGVTVVRVGYDLFREVRRLLTKGQPAANAGTPTLERHIALLRDLITGSGIAVAEIPPVPDGHNLTACLTHDIDHPVLRNHCCDRTMAGLVYRTTIGTLFDFFRGRKTAGGWWRNWTAALKLPFVYLGLARDFWADFDRYLELEAGLGATYFVIPEGGNPGRLCDGRGGPKRASRYEPAEIRPQLEKAAAAGCEVALHGIDAWCDGAKGAAERGKLPGKVSTGVRMHWLFFDGNSPAILDQAGFSYDSTVGYNETVGYRAGTAQAYKPLAAAQMMELPLILMDTALFYPNYLNVSETDAERLAWRLADEVQRFGGVFTINWHDRSIAPERLWDGFYMKLIAELKRRGAWFPNAAQAVEWFQKRRRAGIEAVYGADGKLTVKISGRADDKLPGLKIRVHQRGTRKLSAMTAADRPSAGFTDRAMGQGGETNFTV